MINCPVCGETRKEYLFIRFGLTYSKCQGCALIKAEKAGEGYGAYIEEKGALPEDLSSSTHHASLTETEAVQTYFAMLKSRGLGKNSRALLIAENGRYFLPHEKPLGLRLTIARNFEDLNDLKTSEKFEAVLLIYQLEKSHHPGKVLKQIHTLLKPDGLLLVVLPSLDSRAARLFGSAWTEWRPENKFYFSESTIQLFLWKSSFLNFEIQDDDRPYTMKHINQRAVTLPRTWVTRAVKLLYKIFPKPFRNWKFTLPSSGLVVIGTKAESVKNQTCTFIVPAFNEARTFPVLMTSLLEKCLPDGVQKEVIIIESNSSDGTREQVAKFDGQHGIKVIYQDQPRGKGNAVREGFDSASGDIIVIQDADLEYDLNDLDELLAPLLKYQAAFVLGSRHGGQWKMRQFADEKGMSAFFNFGHQLFTGLLNLLYGQKLKDPFTMYKVFRSDCLYGLRLEANRFDFDFELVIKLIRKGYRPLEIPINYRSRSFKEGKKVRIFRDPLTWIWALVKYRFAPIYRTEK